MVWLISGMFYLALMAFFLGAFALSRRTDDQAERAERRLFDTGQPESTRDAIRIHKLVEVDRDDVNTTASPLTNDSACDKRLAG